MIMMETNLKESFSSPGVHAWDSRRCRFVSLLQEALSAASARLLPSDVRKPYKWGLNMRVVQCIPGVNAWAREKAQLILGANAEARERGPQQLSRTSVLLLTILALSAWCSAQTQL